MYEGKLLEAAAGAVEIESVALVEYRVPESENATTVLEDESLA